MAGYPGDCQILWESIGPLFLEGWLELVWSDEVESGSGDFDCNRAVVLCHPDTPLHPPACFLARFPGGTGKTSPMKITGSGRVSETVFTTEPDQYLDEPVLVYTTAEDVTKLMLAQELQSTGDDTFVALARSGLQSVPGVDTHRLEAIEPLIRRGAGVHPGTREITVAPIASQTLEEIGTLGIGALVPALNDTVQPVKVPVGLFQTARFLGFQLFGTNTNCVFRYLGAILRGRRIT